MKGHYANYFAVGHNAFEFVLDFGQRYPSEQEAETYTRIITTPSYAKAFMETLVSSITRYEVEFGGIASAQVDSEHDAGV
jgi:Protein of unknown function (DUF3467)